MFAYVYPHRVVKVLVEGDTDPASFEVGALPPCETCSHNCKPDHPLGHRCIVAGCKCTRYVGRRSEITASIAAEVAEALVKLLVARGVHTIKIERNAGKGRMADDARRITTAIETACSAEDAARIAGEPYSIAVETLDVFSTVTRSEPAEEPTEAPPAKPQGWAAPPGWTPPAEALETSAELAAEVKAAEAEAEAAPPPRAVTPEGPRVAGVDPGTGWIGVVVAEVRGGRPHFVDSHTFTLGHVEKRRHVVTDEDVDALLPALVTWLRERSVTHAVVETSNGAWGRSAAEPMRSNRIGGAIRGYVLASGIASETVTESSWYANVVKGRRKGRGRADPALSAALEAGIAGWPTISNEHVRDAGGIVLAQVSPRKPKPKPRPVATEKKTPKKSRKWLEKRAVDRAAARAAKGCTCKGRRRHALTCPARIVT